MKLHHGLLPAVIAIAGADVAMANDLAGIQTDIEAVERGYATLAPGDVPAAQKLIDAFGPVAEKLKASPSKGKPEWKALLERAQAVDKKVRARAAEPPAPTEAMLKAKALLDEIDAGFATLAPGDKAAANALITKNNEVVDLLSKHDANQRRAAIFADLATRVRANDPKIRARLAEPAGAAPSAGAGASPGAGAGTGAGASGGAGADGLDLTIDTSAFSSIDDYNWRGFKDTYLRFVGQLRAGDLRGDPQDLRGALKYMQPGPKTNAAIAQANGLIDRYAKVRAERAAAAQAAQESQRAKDAQDAEEINKILGELDGYFGKEFSAKMPAPYDAPGARRWVAQLAEWGALKAKGAAMMAKVKADYPRYAGADAVKRLDSFFAKGLDAKIAWDVEATTGVVRGASMAKEGPLAERIVRGLSYLAPGMFREDLVADESWMSAALKEMTEAVQAVEVMRILRTEHQKRALEPEIERAGKDVAALLEKHQGAASAAYEAARLPKGASEGKDWAAARAAVVASGTPEADILRLVVHYGPTPYETRRESTTEAGGGWIRIERWTEKGEEMQCTVAQREKGDVRMVWYSLKFIRSGHPGSPVGRWFVADMTPEGMGRRIKPENVAK